MMRSLTNFFLDTFQKYRQTLFVLLGLGLVSFIYSTHLSLHLVPKGYDLLFHLGNVFALQLKFNFVHNTFASFGISPLIFSDFGYGTHLFYPPLAHIIPALIAYLLSFVGINSTLLAIRIFSFLTIFLSGATMFYASKKITGNMVYASLASLLYISSPYMQMDYYWRGGMSSSLCFVFLPILILSLYYFTKEKYAPFLFAFVTSMTLLSWSHLISALYSLIFFMLAVGVNFFFVKNKKAAFLSTLAGGIMIGIMTAPFWSLLLQQYMLDTHVIFSEFYPYTISKVANNTISLASLFDLQIAIWQFKIRELFALFNILSVILFVISVLQFKKVKRNFKNIKFIYSLIGLFIFLIFMVTSPILWRVLPNFFGFIQYPHRLILQLTPIVAMLIALPFLLINKITQTRLVLLSILCLFIVGFTHQFNNFELYELGSIDYTTHSILQAKGVENEYLPLKTLQNQEAMEKRANALLPLTNNQEATPSASIITNETPYLLAKIEQNDAKETVFELPRLFYAGYSLVWQAEGSDLKQSLSYKESEFGFIETTIPGNGRLEVQYTGGRWYRLILLSSVATLGYFLLLCYQYTFTKQKVWLEKI